jgi:Replication protein A interacting C-terminal
MAGPRFEPNLVATSYYYSIQHGGKIFVRIIIIIITRNAFCGVRTTADETAIRRGTASSRGARSSRRGRKKKMTTDNCQGRVLPPVGTSSPSASKITPASAEASKLRRRKHSQQQRSSWCRRRQAVRSLIHRELAARRGGRHRGGDADGGYADDDDHMEGVDVVVAPMRMIFDDDDGSTVPVAAVAMRPQRPDTNSTWQDLSEEELLAFLEELERYDDDDDDGLLEHQAEDYRWAALLRQEEQLANDYWEDQYEQWQRQQQQPDDAPDHELLVVPCPVCHRGQLRQEQGSALIYCFDGDSERTMGDDGSCCSFRLYSHLNLAELADRLHAVHQDHARRGCRQLPRIIQMVDNNHNHNNDLLATTTTTTLTAFCVSCGYQSPQIV